MATTEQRFKPLSDLDFVSETARLEVLASVNIQREMKKRKISRRELARRVGMSDKQIVAIFDGNTQMTLGLLAKLGLGLGVHWNFLPIE